MGRYFISGFLLAKIEFWSEQYQISFQFWGKGENNVYINRNYVELASFGGEESIEDILQRVIFWCEKSNPSKQYPMELIGKQIDLPD